MILALGGLLVSTYASATNEYGLADNCQDGVILHCWNWSYNTIKEQLPEIAKAGYTSVQTSPAQRPKDYSSSYTGVSSQWWKFYQPLNFSIATSSQGWLGGADELKALCDEADKYGIKVIVDVVANHMASKNSDSTAPNASAQFNTRDEHYHTYTTINYSNRTSITNGDIDLPDLNTENEEVQAAVKSLLKELIDCGVDGFRFDAAKHIALPSEGSDFWTNVIGYAKELNHDIYVYGEVLDGLKDGSVTASGTNPIEYTELMSITDNRLGNDISNRLNNGYTSNYAGYNATYYNIPVNRLVLWAESHDTFMNDGISNGYSTSAIHKAWAFVAGRSGYTSLYFARPSVSSSGSVNATMGKMTTENWKDAEVVAINKFHNATIGQNDVYKRLNSKLAGVLKSSGAVLVYSKTLAEGETYAAELENTDATVEPGEYTDLISGNTFTVTASTISGEIGETGIAVFYKGADAAIDDIIADKAEATYSINGTTITVSGNSSEIRLYNLQGCLIATSLTNAIEAPDSGIYILTVGGKSHKIIIK